MADVALAGVVIASHYAEPAPRVVGAKAALLSAPGDTAKEIRELARGEPFELLDDSLGWAWGYAGEDRRVGYMRSDALRSH